MSLNQHLVSVGFIVASGSRPNIGGYGTILYLDGNIKWRMPMIPKVDDGRYTWALSGKVQGEAFHLDKASIIETNDCPNGFQSPFPVRTCICGLYWLASIPTVQEVNAY